MTFKMPEPAFVSYQITMNEERRELRSFSANQVRAAYEQGRRDAAPSPGMPSDVAAFLREAAEVFERYTLLNEVGQSRMDNEADEIIAKMRSLAALHRPEQAEKGWISVAERMPRRNRRVLAYFPKESTSVMDGIWDGERFMVNGYDRTHVVTHWHELPAPPGEQVAAEDLGCLTEGE